MERSCLQYILIKLQDFKHTEIDKRFRDAVEHFFPVEYGVHGIY